MNYIIWGINPTNGLREIFADRYGKMPIRNKTLANKLKLEAIGKGWKMLSIQQGEVVRGNLVNLKTI